MKEEINDVIAAYSGGMLAHRAQLLLQTAQEYEAPGYSLTWKPPVTDISSGRSVASAR
jgi:hypothetical protein